MSGCPTSELLSLLLAEQLNPAQYPEIEAHLEECAQCQQKLERFTEPVAALRGRRNPDESAAFPGEEACWVRVEQALARTVTSQAGRSLEPGQTKQASDDSPSPGQLPGYEIREELGRGATGIVYQARRIATDQIVALKVLRARPHRDALTRFRREIEALVWLNHPHIVKILEVGEHRGRPFFAMEFVPGGTLQRCLSSNSLSLAQAVSLMASLAAAIQAAHEHGIIHRDLKPANILLASDGIPRITDFGLARHLDQASDLTHSGTIIGTPCYMAPEQAWGQGHEAGPSADIYSLGAILYQALTGRPPFQGPSVHDILEQARSQPPVSPRILRREISLELEQICLKCLQKQPADRFHSARELADALDRLPVQPSSDPGRPGSVPSRPQAISHGLRAAAIIGSVLLGCGLLLLVLLALQGALHLGAPVPASSTPLRAARLGPSVAVSTATNPQTATHLKGVVIAKPFNNLHQFLAPVGGQETNFAFSPGARAFDRNGEELDPPEIKRVNQAGNAVDVLVEPNSKFKFMTIREIRLVQGELLPADRLPVFSRVLPALNGETDYANALVLRWSKGEHFLVVQSGGQEVTLAIDPLRTQADDGTGLQLFREQMYRVLKEGNVVHIRARTIQNKPTATVIVLRKGKLLSPDEVARRR